MSRLLLASACCLSLAATGVARAEVKVTLTKMHLCCGACVKGVTSAVDKVEGASVEVNKDDGSAVVTAETDQVAQKALNAIARNGFHGKSDHAKIKMRDSGVKAGKVTRLELAGIHNCCGGCNRAIKAALASVEGVTGDTAKVKQKKLVVEGDFDGLLVVKALNDVGFHVRAVKEKKKKE